MNVFASHALSCIHFYSGLTLCPTYPRVMNTQWQDVRSPHNLG